MKVYRPIKTNFLTQGFGDNKPCAKTTATGEPIRPFRIVTRSGSLCPVGYVSFYPLIGLRGHNGFDHAAWSGEALYFPVDCPEAGGWSAIEASDVDGGLGVDVVSKNPVDFGGRTTHIKFRFWHLKRAWKDVDVKFGELIGFCDNTGASSGDHLHWSMKRCDANGRGLDSDNGYDGAVDFNVVFRNTFVLDVIGEEARAITVIEYAKKVILEVTLYLQSLRR